MTVGENQNRRALARAAAALRLIPPGAPGAALMRHAERGDIPPGSAGNEILLTPQGGRDAEEMGRILRGRLSAVRHSPVPRCRQTALKIQGAGGGPLPAEWRPLAFHAFAEDPDAATPVLLRLVSEKGFYDRFVSTMATADAAPYPGFAPPLIASAKLAARMIMMARGGFCVGVTHDWLVNVAAARASGRETKRAAYAGFLDALFLWEEDGQVMFFHMEKHGPCARRFQHEYAAARAALARD